MIVFKFSNGDFNLQGDGKLETVKGVDLLKQKVQKRLSTDKENVLNYGSIPFRYNPTFGTNLNYVRQLNSIFTSEDARKSVQTEVRNALLDYAKEQNPTFRYGLTADETLSDANVLASLTIDNSQIKRVVITYEAEIISASGKTSNLEGDATSPLGA